MTNQRTQHPSLNISLIKAREALMSYIRPLLTDAGVTDQQWRIIRLLSENGVMDFQDLSHQASILRPSLTGILTRLEKLNYVVRLKPNNDHRRVFLNVTPEGQNLYDHLCARIDERYQLIIQHLTIEKFNLLATLLEELTQIAIDNCDKD